jgi:hypothetical protein
LPRSMPPSSIIGIPLVAPQCHCEERSDAAIPTRVSTYHEIASLRSQ